MIISMKYAKRLQKNGKAKFQGLVRSSNNGQLYLVIDRYDLQRTDHVRMEQIDNGLPIDN